MTVRRTVPALLGAGLAVVAILLAHESDKSAYSVRAEFENAAGLRRGQLVKIDGVRVGTVSKLDVTSRDTALATLRLDDAGAPVGTGAHAFVRPVNLIGEKYVDLDVGDTKRPLPSDTLIPRQRTGTPVELDDVINTLDASTRMRLAILIDQSGRALVGRGADLGATLRRLPPALDRAGALVAALARDNHALGRLVEDSDTVVGAIAGQRRALGRLVDSTGVVLAGRCVRRRLVSGLMKPFMSRVTSAGERTSWLRNMWLGPSAIWMARAQPSRNPSRSPTPASSVPLTGSRASENSSRRSATGRNRRTTGAPSRPRRVNVGATRRAASSVGFAAAAKPGRARIVAVSPGALSFRPTAAGRRARAVVSSRPSVLRS